MDNRPVTPSEEAKEKKREKAEAEEAQGGQVKTGLLISSEDSEDSQTIKKRMLQAKRAQTTVVNEEEAMLARDNLKIKTMAKYKSIKAGELHLYQEIENQLVDLALCKGKAFEDSSMEEKERAIESELDQRGLNNPDNNFGRRSDNSELLGSVISDEDYWQDIIDSKRLTKERGRSIIARTNNNVVAQKQKTLEKRQSK